jgi:hypothetical protein
MKVRFNKVWPPRNPVKEEPFLNLNPSKGIVFFVRQRTLPVIKIITRWKNMCRIGPRFWVREEPEFARSTKEF